MASYQPGEYFRRFQVESLARRQENDEECLTDNSEFSLDDDSPTQMSSEPVIPSSNTSTTCRRTTSTSVNKKTNSKRKAKKSDEVVPKKAKKFAWSSEAAEVLLKYVKEFKTQCEYKGIDFEVDLAILYTEVRRCMGIDYSEDFGPENVSEPVKEVKDMDASEYEEYRKKSEEQKERIRTGYQRVKEKIKSIRQDYRCAVNKGTRSGSGKVVQEHFELLTTIWGGSPSTTSLEFGIDGGIIDDDKEDQPKLTEGKNCFLGFLLLLNFIMGILKVKAL